ncbi:unnamed protein product [Caenorhabditis sp. 36 PRJEB53466]|nr:unnamed protein product [Caenorhabditis sp. 36 PRJEB53466]
MTQEGKKSQYFSNGDFEKVAADIISSPRRLKHSSPGDSSDSLFRISEKQQEYYSKCFRHLIKSTQGAVDLSGALCGADQRIVAFFKRSSLDVASLSKIWSLADVNEDGWLDLSEFSIAMHLVVLRVKGEVPIPDALPSFAKPPMTAQRERSQSSRSTTERGPVPVLVSPSPTPWAGAPAIKQFSDTPPLLVDSRPTAIKHSALLALKSPSGPPPIPPVRPQQRGHNRSASLDLKLIALNNGKVSSDPSVHPPNTLSLWSSHSDPQPVSSTTTTATFASFPGTPDSIPPPIPQRITPSPLPKVIEEEKEKEREKRTSDSETQTEGVFYAEEEVETFFGNLGHQIDDLLGEEIGASDGQGLERWSKRCTALRQQNAELEAERARLAQVRIQLEIRLQEFEERSKTACSSSTLMKLLAVLLLIAPIIASPCTTTDQIKFLQCKGTILKIQDTLRTYASQGDKLPPQSVFKQISKLCNSAVNCVGQIECVEAKKGVGMMHTACEGIELSAGPFGECMARIQTNPPSVKEYPCAYIFEKEALDSKSKRCKMFSEDVECVARVSKELCGSTAADAFRKGIPSMRTLLKC